MRSMTGYAARARDGRRSAIRPADFRRLDLRTIIDRLREQMQTME
ncbi:hypothetical protein [Jannaschia rubra]|uniref:Uncharacterized protein n=1 Tax=Jannaschia rubra TaxID=282197 RepID=A0A0M6XUR8_9RHOB|nr:hypothetical protein [Jannaschia rubra]CTQ33971.1 hypothetical protein JAN5088_02760 [Jannaschia rubra]SFG26186.1 hypothetical protein SAMN04488517_103378 [Jannaschia rubra]